MTIKNVLVIGDTHIPFVHKGYLDFCLRIKKHFKCTQVVHIGDLVDNHSISYHDHDPNGWSPSDEMKASDKILANWFKAFPSLLLARGNHDCYDQQTEILTTKGWKLGIDLNEDDVVGTLNIKTNCVEYKKPYAIIKKDYNGEMIKVGDSHGIDMLVTPSHRMMVSSKDTKITEPIYSFKLAHTLNKSYRYFAVSGSNDNKELFDVSDDQLRLLGWVLTDGYIKGSGYVIAQSKVKNLGEIKRVLESCGLMFKDSARQRNITEICGRELLKPPLLSHEFSFKSEWLNNVLSGNKKLIPSFCSKLNKRQFKVFFKAIVDGDGSSYADYRVGNCSSYVIHGTKDFLEQLQILCLQNEHHASLRVVREKDYRLNVVEERIKVGHTTGASVVDYNGLVWCASVDNTTLIVRRNGNVQIHGNCLVDRKSKTVGLPSRCFKDFREMWNLPSGWKDDWEFEIGGVKYLHGTGFSGQLGHMKAVYANRMSCVIGHLHSVLGVSYTANNRDIVFGMSVGCGIERKSYAFDYGRDFKEKPILGCGVVSYTRHGVNAQVIPMEL